MWAAGVAARLKLLQIDGADATAAQRGEFFTEEIGRALKPIPAAKRDAYLDALAEKFPAWGLENSVESKPAAAPAPASPETLLSQLIAAIPQMDSATRQDAAHRLAEAGLGAVPARGGACELPAELQKKLGLDSGAVATDKAAQLLTALLQEFTKLEPLAWETWAQLAPRSAVRRDPATEELKTAAGRFLRGEAALAPCQQGLEKTRKLMAGLLAAIAMGGKEFAEEYMVRFLPQNIEDVVHSRGGGGLFGDSTEKKCWVKYKELAYGDPGAIEKRIRDAIARQAEEIAKKA